jgi:GNAT superfamily N-acetyltransferase
VIALLFNQRQMTTTVGGYATIDEMRREWQSSMIKPAIDVRLVFDRREQLIGYIEVWTTSLGAHPWLWGCVHPDFEGRGIGTTLLRWAEARVRLSLEVLPQHLMLAPRFGTIHELKTAAALCAALGWQPVSEPEGLLPQVRGLASAVRLTHCEGSRAGYDVYEKVIRSGDEFVPAAV